MEFIRPGTQFDFVGQRKLFAIISASLVLASILLILIVKPNYGIDFKGGTNIIVRFTQPVELAEVSSTMRDIGFDDAVVQQYGSADNNQFLIETNRISVITTEQADQIRQTLEQTFGSEGFLFSYDADSGDRIEIKAPDAAFAHLGDQPAEVEPPEEELQPEQEVPQPAQIEEGTGEGTGDGTGEGTGAAPAADAPTPPAGATVRSELSPEEVYITQILEAAGLQHPQVTQIGNPRHRRFLIRLQELQGRVEDGLLSRFGQERIPVEGMEIHLAQTTTPQQITDTLHGLGFETALVQVIEPASGNRFFVRATRSDVMNQDEANRIASGLQEAFDVQEVTTRHGSVQRVETVGPRVGSQLRAQAIKAIILALFFILIYIGLRFNMRFAPGAVVALFHDVLITLGIFVILREEVSLTVLAALLTIVGYSLNDTIVVFDRIRENLGMLRSKTMLEVVNLSINETLSRTILTSVTTLLTLFAIYFIGVGSIKVFAFAMIIGIVVGTYSTIYIASPVMIYIHHKLEQRQAKLRESAAPGAGRRQARRQKSRS
ncbi:MAG: protein translocase subunit SecF [Bradymonadales bacterium]|nr:protein translocase subunit SecF [Bradymonadales bacterium]